MTVTYSNGDPTYTVTIPESVTVDGSSVKVTAEDVVLAEGNELNVTITATSEQDNSFKVRSNSGTGDDTLSYSVNSGSYILNSEVLTVDPASSSEGEVELSYTLDDGQTPKFSGTYSGTMTFTVSVDAK